MRMGNAARKKSVKAPQDPCTTLMVSFVVGGKQFAFAAGSKLQSADGGELCAIAMMDPNIHRIQKIVITVHKSHF